MTVFFLREAYDDRTAKQNEGACKAQQVLGYDRFRFLGIPDEDLGTMPPRTMRLVEEWITRVNPSVLYTTFPGDIHQDHAGTFKAVRMGTRVLNMPKIGRLLVGEIPSSTTQSLTTDIRFRPNFYEVLTREMVLRKAEALAAYGSEHRDWPHPRSTRGVEVQAEYRGMEIGRHYAEAFMMLRAIQH